MSSTNPFVYKIGILSMQKVVNYGSFLQAFSLLETIKKLRPESDVMFIDIKPGISLYKRKPVFYYLKKLISLFFKRKLRYILLSRKRNKKIKNLFIKYWNEYLKITSANNGDIHFNTVVIGSDEVFNCLQDVPWGFSENLIGKGINSNNIITYAASCGHTSIFSVEKMFLSETIENGFNNIKVFSVRDENTRQFVEKFASKKSYIHLDPVFLFNYDTYMPKNNYHGKIPYVLIYAYNNRIKKKEEIAAICNFAKNNGMEIISVFGYQSWCKNVILDPFELLAYFKLASYIITDTFHGSVLSIKYNKQFVSFIRYADSISPNSNKLYYLLEKFNLQSREVKDIHELSERLYQKIDYEKVNFMIDVEIQKSLEYLDAYL